MGAYDLTEPAEGSAFAGNGRHGSIIPKPGQVRSPDPGPLARPAVVASAPTRHFRQVFSATTGDRSRATRARSHPNNPVHRRISGAKPRAPCTREPATELRREGPAPHKLLAVCKPELHRPAVPRKPVEVPALRTHQRVPPNQRPVLRSRTPESYKPGPMPGR